MDKEKTVTAEEFKISKLKQLISVIILWSILLVMAPIVVIAIELSLVVMAVVIVFIGFFVLLVSLPLTFVMAVLGVGKMIREKEKEFNDRKNNPTTHE